MLNVQINNHAPKADSEISDKIAFEIRKIELERPQSYYQAANINPGALETAIHISLRTN